jgi:hypothetical protein
MLPAGRLRKPGFHFLPDYKFSRLDYAVVWLLQKDVEFLIGNEHIVPNLHQGHFPLRQIQFNA